MNRIVMRSFALVAVLFVAACQQETSTVESAGSVAGEPTAAAVAPVPVPEHDTPYAVGSTTVFIHDRSRPYDSVAGIDTGIRTLLTEIWYPVSRDEVPGNFRKATYGDYVLGSREVHQMMMTQTTFFHMLPSTVREGVTQQQIDGAIEELFSRERGSYVDAPLISPEMPLPVVVMTHGDAGSRYNMETVCEYLAAHGYVVIAPEHTGNSPYSMTGWDPALQDGGDAAFRESMEGVLAVLGEHGTYGAPETYGQSFTPLAEGRETAAFQRELDASLLQRLGDLRATLSELDRMQAEGRFAGLMDLDRIGLVGRSFGGATTLLGLGMEPRFTSGFSVVPPGYPDMRPSFAPEALKPAGEESVLLSAGGPFPLLEFRKPLFLLSGAEDNLIIGLGAFAANMLGGETPSADNPHPQLRSAYEASDAPIIWGMLADSNHSTLGVSGGYWWPDLKPNMHERTFEPGVKFKLMAPSRAQKMQREKALAFFDLTIRQDASAKDRLLDQSWATEGLTLESRNF